jgi:hypothetical protein
MSNHDLQLIIEARRVAARVDGFLSALIKYDILDPLHQRQANDIINAARGVTDKPLFSNVEKAS